MSFSRVKVIGIVNYSIQREFGEGRSKQSPIAKLKSFPAFFSRSYLGRPPPRLITDRTKRNPYVRTYESDPCRTHKAYGIYARADTWTSMQAKGLY
jgi:hypothetical protein